VEIFIIPRKTRSFSVNVVPNADQHIDLSSKLTKINWVKKKDKPEEKKPSVEPPPKKGGNLSSNPFRLKKNPFAVGE
jgi:hypothetical protein